MAIQENVLVCRNIHAKVFGDCGTSDQQSLSNGLEKGYLCGTPNFSAYL